MAQVDGATWTYFAHDHLDSPRMNTDASKNVTGRQEYTPYGEIYASVSPGTTRGYTGHDYDAVSGLYFAPFRFYAPGLSRWLTPDPLGMVDGPNMYGYVGGNPIANSDELGLSFMDWFEIWGQCMDGGGSDAIQYGSVAAGAGSLGLLHFFEKIPKPEGSNKLKATPDAKGSSDNTNRWVARRTAAKKAGLMPKNAVRPKWALHAKYLPKAGFYLGRASAIGTIIAGGYEIHRMSTCGIDAMDIGGRWSNPGME